MPPENNPRAWPLAVAIYGHDVRVVSDPAMLDRELVVHDRASNEGERFDGRRIPRSGELAGSGVLRYGELTIDPRTRTVVYGPMPVRLRRREYALLV
jgi:DNA-binding response OmpR family regulator